MLPIGCLLFRRPDLRGAAVGVLGQTARRIRGSGMIVPVTDLSALVGSEVRRLLLDHQVTLFFAQGPTSGTVVSCQIIIDAPFQLDRAGHVDHVDPKRNDTLPPLCRLLHTTVGDAQVDQDVLTVSFDDGSTLTISPIARFAAWQMVGQGIPHLVAALVQADENLLTQSAERNALIAPVTLLTDMSMFARRRPRAATQPLRQSSFVHAEAIDAHG